MLAYPVPAIIEVPLPHHAYSMLYHYHYFRSNDHLILLHLVATTVAPITSEAVTTVRLGKVSFQIYIIFKTPCSDFVYDIETNQTN